MDEGSEMDQFFCDKQLMLDLYLSADKEAVAYIKRSVSDENSVAMYARVPMCIHFVEHALKKQRARVWRVLRPRSLIEMSACSESPPP